jgi:hypothetical protein
MTVELLAPDRSTIRSGVFGRGDNGITELQFSQKQFELSGGALRSGLALKNIGKNGGSYSSPRLDSKKALIKALIVSLISGINKTESLSSCLTFKPIYIHRGQICQREVYTPISPSGIFAMGTLV